MNQTICNKPHRYNEYLNDLPDDQSGSGRHKCPGCALEMGFEDGFNGFPQKSDFSNLPNSQAGSGRHKDANAAYQKGYALGASKRQQSAGI